MVGCQYAGMMYFSGSGVKMDASQGALFYRRACEGGNADACEKQKRQNDATGIH